MIGIVILNYQKWDETIKCIKSIFDNPPEIEDYKIYIVDNASTVKPNRNFYDLIADKNVDLIFSDKNGGYAAGNNIGIKKAITDKCDIIVISNSDIYYQKNSLKEMSIFYSKNTGICFPKIFTLEGEVSQIYKKYFTSLKEIYISATPLRKLFNEYLGRKIGLLNLETDVYVKTHLNMGPCFAIDLKSAKLLTPLDENTVLYYEECILSRAADKNNIDIYYCPQSWVVHGEGKSTVVSPFSLTCYEESTLYYCRHILNKNKWSTFPLLIFYILYFDFRCLFNNEFRTNRIIHHKKLFLKWR